jgi:hypothetical protein
VRVAGQKIEDARRPSLTGPQFEGGDASSGAAIRGQAWRHEGASVVLHQTMAMPTSHRIPSHSLASERLVFTVGEAGELLGISRAFGAVSEEFIIRAPLTEVEQRFTRSFQRLSDQATDSSEST